MKRQRYNIAMDADTCGADHLERYAPSAVHERT